MEKNILKHFTILASSTTKTSLYLLIVIFIITNLQYKQIDARIIEGEIRTNEVSFFSIEKINQKKNDQKFCIFVFFPPPDN